MFSSFFFAGLVLFGCAAAPVDDVVPEMSVRTFEISRAVPGLRYPYRVCVKKNLFGGCKESKIVTEEYDFTKPEVKTKFIDMGVECRVRETKFP